MTSIFDDNGKNIPCAVLQVGLLVFEVRKKAVDGSDALQLGFDDESEKTKSRYRSFQKS